MKKLHNERRDYGTQKMTEQNMLANPFAQFLLWYDAINDDIIKDKTAMVLATVDTTQQPHQRIVLLKEISQDGFIFFTNRCSQKSQDISNNQQVSILFPWQNISKQVIILGKTQLLSQQETDNYFLSRPYKSQISAWASQQSQIIPNRATLEKAYLHYQEYFTHNPMTTPKDWIGYIIKPHSFEFWQGGEHRLHDRIRYKIKKDQWLMERLAP